MTENGEMEVDLGGGRRRTVKPNYPGNTNKAKESSEPEVPENPRKVEKVITGEVIQRKKPLSRRIADTFTGDDMRSVGQFVLFDVIIPAAKDLIADVVTQGLQRSLFGDSRPISRTSSRSSGYTSYNRMHDSNRRPEQKREMSYKARATHDFNEVILDNRGEAEEVIERLGDLIATYNMATVSDLYELVGITGTFTDEKWGWEDIRGASVTRVHGGGYLLNLPRTIPVD